MLAAGPTENAHEQQVSEASGECGPTNRAKAQDRQRLPFRIGAGVTRWIVLLRRTARIAGRYARVVPAGSRRSAVRGEPRDLLRPIRRGRRGLSVMAVYTWAPL